MSTDDPNQGFTPADLAELLERWQLEPKQLMFCERYLACLNQTRAARQAGYGTTDASAAVTASRLLQNAKIKAYIAYRFAQVRAEANEVLARVTAIARGDLGDYINIANGSISDQLSAAQLTGNTYVIKKFKRKVKDGEIIEEIELSDPLRALELLGKHHKLWADVMAKPEDQLPPEELSEADLERAAIEALERGDLTADDLGLANDNAD